MPMADMPMEKLIQYQGINPIPGDFRSFWEEQRDRAYKRPLDYRLTPARLTPARLTKKESCKPDSFFIENTAKGQPFLFQDLWMTGMDGGRLHAKYLRPAGAESVPLILQFHGYPGAARSWFELASFVGLGFAVLAMECPGQGGASQDRGQRTGTTASDHIIRGLDGPAHDMYYVQTFLDTCLMARIARGLEDIDRERIYVNGASQGAALGLVCTALNPGIVGRCAALYPFLSDYRRAWEMDRDEVVYDGLKYYTRWFDPNGERTEEIFVKLGYIDVQNFADRIECPVLFGTGLADGCCPPSTQFAVFHKIRAPKKHLIYPEYGHEEIGAFDDRLIRFFGEKEDALCLESI